MYVDTIASNNVGTERKCNPLAQIDRAEKNRQFQAIGEKFVKEYHSTTNPLTRKYLIDAKGCMEQLGRMVKAGMEAATIAKQAEIVADALNEGRTVKQVEAYLRHGRITGEWDKSLLTATKEAASNTAKSIEGLTPSDLIAIVCHLEAFANDNDDMADIMKRERNIKPGEWDDPYMATKRCADSARMYAGKVKAAFETMTGEKYPTKQV